MQTSPFTSSDLRRLSALRLCSFEQISTRRSCKLLFDELRDPAVAPGSLALMMAQPIEGCAIFSGERLADYV
jgi:hypothetical protein